MMWLHWGPLAPMGIQWRLDCLNSWGQDVLRWGRTVIQLVGPKDSWSGWRRTRVLRVARAPMRCSSRRFEYSGLVGTCWADLCCGQIGDNFVVGKEGFVAAVLLAAIWVRWKVQRRRFGWKYIWGNGRTWRFVGVYPQRQSVTSCALLGVLNLSCMSL